MCKRDAIFLIQTSDCVRNALKIHSYFSYPLCPYDYSAVKACKTALERNDLFVGSVREKFKTLVFPKPLGYGAPPDNKIVGKPLDLKLIANHAKTVILTYIAGNI